MTFAKTAGLTAGFLGAFGLGIALGPSIVDRHDLAPSVVDQRATPAADDPAPAPAAPARVKRAPAPGFAANRAVVIVPPASHPELQRRLKPVLNRGADMNKAADGFRNAEEFAVVAHAARDTQVPFMLLKHRVLEEGLPLDKAIQASKPDVNAKAVVEKAKTAAADDVKEL